MKAVVVGFVVRSGRTSGSVRYAYATTAKPPATSAAITCRALFTRIVLSDGRRRTRLQNRSPVHNNLQPFTRPRLIVDRMAVHDRERGRLDDAVSGAGGDRLPGVPRARGVEIDPVRLQPFRVGAGEGTEGIDRVRERRFARVVRVERRDAGE